MNKQYFVVRFFENLPPSVDVCEEIDLGRTIKNFSNDGKDKIRIFEWDLNKLGLDEVEVKTEIRKKEEVPDTFTSKEDEEIRENNG